ncbi:hypothetical protein M899_3050 [Bacteriovorax sp. BSW11_IV]|uniref:hypothetical protein n=1 Tax=Bacteriovorax sp. BSW11_IV TaxID=1353529 RepID=UPI00038A310B|nr:hypothetical protein [Bacteriovorax sp. BSW11_IV]EQC49527.1 hypothetical protein M899_3050 [Bacteriovorax sp. BSW11_IV]
MNLWLKIEKIINNILGTFFALLGSFIKKLTPSKIKTTIRESKKVASNTKSNLRGQLDKTKEKANKLAHNSTKLAKQKIEQASQKARKAKSFDWKSIDLKKIGVILLALFGPRLLKLKMWYLSLKPMTVVSFIVAGAATSLTGITVYTQSKSIVEKTTEAERIPASVISKYVQKRGGDLHLIDQRSLRLGNVQMPVYVESQKHLNTLIMDFTIISSNRYIREYFFDMNNETLLRDRLSSTVQPFLTDFSLEEEGKTIIKNKIKKEVNALIKDLQIKGEVEDVYIHSLLAN